MKKGVVIHFCIWVIAVVSAFSFKEAFRILFWKVPNKSYPVFDIKGMFEKGFEKIEFSMNTFSVLNLIIFFLSGYLLCLIVSFYIRSFVGNKIDWSNSLKRIGFIFLFLLVIIVLVVTGVVLEVR